MAILPGNHFTAVKWGPGVVGRTAPVAVSAIIALTLLGWVVKDTGLLAWVVGALILFIFAYPIAAFWYANKYPGLAVTEGAEALQWRQADMAAKDKTIEVEPNIRGVPPPAEIASLGKPGNG